MSVQFVRQTVAEMGRCNAFYYFLGRFLQRLSRNRAGVVRYYFVAQPIPEKETAPLRPSAASSIRQVGQADPIVSHFPRPAPVIAHRFADENLCFVAEHKERFAGFIWFARDAYEEDEARCRYVLERPDLTVWDYDVYIEPEFRIGRTFSRLWETANQALSAQGIRWSLSRISAFNTASLAVHSRLGIRKLGTGTFIILWAVQIALFDRAPFVHIGLSRRYRPVLSFSPPGD